MYVYSDRGPRRLLPNAGFSANGEAPPLTWLPLTSNPSAACGFASAGASAGAGAAGWPGAAAVPFAATCGLGFAGAGAAGFAGAGEPCAARVSASAGVCTVACIWLRDLSFRSQFTPGAPGPTPTSCFSGENPDISTCMLQVPSARSGNEYTPIPSVMAVAFASSLVAVTVTPGTGKPPNVTCP